MEHSRTHKTFINAFTSLVFFSLNIPIAFVTRALVLKYLGADILGMQGVIGSVLSFLNLSELGLVSAILFAVYKPLFHRDRYKLNEIISVEGWFYQKIGIFIIIGALFFSLFFSKFFSHTSFPLWYTYIVLFAYILSNCLSYFTNYRNIIISADQRWYEFSIRFQIATYILTFISWGILIYCPSNKFLYYQLVGILGAIISTLITEYLIRKKYSWVKPQKRKGLKFLKKNPVLIRKTIQIAFQRLAAVILEHTDNIFLYIYVSLSMIAYLGNYYILINSCAKIKGALFASIGSGIGSIVAEGNKKKIVDLYWEYFAGISFVTSVAIVALLCYTHHIIYFWLGAKYIIGNTSLLILVLGTFILFTRIADNFLSAYGLFRDVWAPLAEALIKVVFVLLLGYFWNVNGVLMGGFLGTLFMGGFWKPYFLFRAGFKLPVSQLWINTGKYYLVSWFSILLGWYLFRVFHFNVSTILRFIIVIILYSGIFSIVQFILFYIFFDGFRRFVYRVYHLLLTFFFRKFSLKQ